MSKISFIAKQYKVLTMMFVFTFLAAYPSAYANNISDTDVERRVENLSSAVDLRYTAAVQKHIVQYTKNNKQGTEVLLGRVSIYFPMFENILRQKGLPEDLKYLSIIESGLKPTATSRVGAAGLWQFMKSTGRMMGLKVTSTIDERRDPVKSTEAAAEYLKYLHEKFGDWTLALAAYNCGPGNVRKAIRKAGGKKSYWEIQKYLPRETRNYIPKFTAVSYLMHYYYDHNLVPQMPEDHFMNTSTAQVYDKVSLKKVSNQLNINMQVIKSLNPSYLKNYIPATEDGRYMLTLPTEMMYEFVNQTSSATLLARGYARSTSKARTRDLVSVTYLPNYIKEYESIEHRTIKSHGVTPSIARILSHRSTRLNIRESLKDVARRTGTTVDELLELNGYSEALKPTVGSIIKLPAKE